MANDRSNYISNHFTEAEVKCKCGQCHFDMWMNPIFIQKLEGIRTDVEFPLIVNSGARCAQHNADVGGALQSAHLVDRDKPANAIDIKWNHLSGEDKFKLLRSAFKHAIRGIGISDKFLHLDQKKRRAVWTYD